MNYQEFTAAIENRYHKYFKDSRAEVEIDRLFTEDIIGVFNIAKDSREVAHAIMANDMLNFCFTIKAVPYCGKVKPDTQVPEQLRLEVWHNSYRTKPTDKYCVFASKKFEIRKTHGSPDKLLKYVDKVFSRLYNQLVEELKNDNIHQNHVELLRQKLGL